MQPDDRLTQKTSEQQKTHQKIAVPLAPNTFDEWGHHLIHMQASSGDLKALIATLKSGIDINLRTLHKEETPLMFAAAYGRENVVEFLLKQQNIDLEAPTVDGVTALGFAAQNGNFTILAAFCEANAQVNVRDSNGVTPLYKAAQKGHLESVLILCNVKEIDINAATNSSQATPLHVAAFLGHSEIVKCLLSLNANKTLKTNSGKLPIDFAKTDELRNLLT